MVKTRCAICGEDNSRLLYKANFNFKDINETIFSARRIPDKIHYRIVRCRKCGLVYSNPILEFEEIEKLYKKSKYTYGEYENDLNQTYGRYLRRFIKVIPAKNRLLEIGCGNGFFLKEAKRIGFKEVWGVEPGKEIVKKADVNVRKQIIVDIFKKGQFKRNYFDIICMFQVLDHLTDPNFVLQECHRILKPGGCLLCINHNVDAMSAKIMGEKSPIFDIEHTFLYNKQTLLKLFRNNNFIVSEVFNAANLYPLAYWLRMLPLPKLIKRFLYRSAENLRFGRIKTWLNVGNIGILAFKK